MYISAMYTIYIGAIFIGAMTSYAWLYRRLLSSWPSVWGKTERGTYRRWMPVLLLKAMWDNPWPFWHHGLLKSDFWPHFCEYLWKLFQVQSTWENWASSSEIASLKKIYITIQSLSYKPAVLKPEQLLAVCVRMCMRCPCKKEVNTSRATVPIIWQLCSNHITWLFHIGPYQN